MEGPPRTVTSEGSASAVERAVERVGGWQVLPRHTACCTAEAEELRTALCEYAQEQSPLNPWHCSIQHRCPLWYTAAISARWRASETRSYGAREAKQGARPMGGWARRVLAAVKGPTPRR